MSQKLSLFPTVRHLHIYFIILLQLKILETKHQTMQDDVQTMLFYVRIMLVLTVIMAFMMMWQFLQTNNGSNFNDCSMASFQTSPEVTAAAAATAEESSVNATTEL